MACAIWVQYSLKGQTKSNVIVLQTVSVAIVGSVGIGGILKTACRLSENLLRGHTPFIQRSWRITTVLAWARMATISGSWLLMSTQSDHKRRLIFEKLGLLAAPVFSLVYFLFYAQWQCVLAAHRKCARIESSKLEFDGLTTTSTSVLHGLPLKVNIALCAVAFASATRFIGSGLIEIHGNAVGSSSSFSV